MKSIAADSSKSRPSEADWNRIAASAGFRHLLSVKRMFIVPAFLFFLVYYLLLPVLVGCAPRLMSTRVFGAVTLAYVFALSQFAVGWTIAVLYLKASSRFDRLIKDLLDQDLLEQDLLERDSREQSGNLRGGR
jgi:uncharacterized membrane protein (DUF485 family)